MVAYQPIECGLHSQYELAIMQGRKVMLSWQLTDGRSRTERVRLVDIYARNHEEFLLVAYDGRHEEIRLDRITEFHR